MRIDCRFQHKETTLAKLWHELKNIIPFKRVQLTSFFLRKKWVEKGDSVKKKNHLNINNFHYKQFNLQNYAVLAVLEQKMMDVCGF